MREQDSWCSPDKKTIQVLNAITSGTSGGQRFVLLLRACCYDMFINALVCGHYTPQLSNTLLSSTCYNSVIATALLTVYEGIWEFHQRLNVAVFLCLMKALLEPGQLLTVGNGPVAHFWFVLVLSTCNHVQMLKPGRCFHRVHVM